MTAAVPEKSGMFQQELEALFRENYRVIYQAAYSVTGSPQDAEDVLQTIFARLIQWRPSVRLIPGQPPTDFDKNPQGYLYRAAINEALKVVRSRERRKLAHDDVDALEIPAPESDPDRDDQIQLIRAAMEKMKPQQVGILNLRYKEDYTCREIAKILGRPAGTVFAELFRARAELKRLVRIQEKQREKKQEKHEADRRAILADSSGTRDGSRREPGSETAPGRLGEARHAGPLFIL